MQWPGLLSYPEAVGAMEARVAAIHEGRAPEAVWLVEHPPLYTAGTSANPADLLDARFPVYSTGRGGQYTYHGPGQRVAYVMLDLKRRQEAPDIKRYIRQLEEWIVRALGRFGIEGERRDGRVGIWVETQGGGEAKIAAIGVRVRHWVTYHGIAVNVDPDLSHFSGIVPCGIRGHGVTSIRELTGGADMAALDKALEGAWAEIFEEGAGARSESVR